MYKFEKETCDEFEKATGLDLTIFFDEQIPRAIQEYIITLMEIEYKRGDAREDELEELLEQRYNAGYDEAMDDFTRSCNDAYNDGYADALKDAQKAILHIER